MLDLLGGLGGAQRQATHFGCHHRETTAGVAGARRFDRGVKRQQIGLGGNAVDDADDVGNLGRRLADVVNRRDHPRHDVSAFFRGAHGAVGDIGALMGMFGVFLHRRGQLLHARGRLFERGGLRVRARRQVGIADGDVASGRLHAAEVFTDVADDAVQIAVDLAHGANQLAELIAAVDVDRRGEIAAGDALRDLERRFDRSDDLARQKIPGQDGCRHGRARERTQPDLKPRGGDGLGRPYRPPQRADNCKHKQLRDRDALAERELAKCDRPAEQTAGDNIALAQRQAAGPFHFRLVEPCRGVDLLPARLGAHGNISGDRAALHDRRDGGFNPVIVAILAPVFHHGGPGLAGLDGGPQVGEGRRRHIGVTHHVVRRADQFLFRKAADLDEVRIGVRNPAFEIGRRINGPAAIDFVFDVADRMIDAHR